MNDKRNEITKNLLKNRFSTFNRSSLLLTPTKKNKFHDESKSSSDTDTNESILDINVTIIIITPFLHFHLIQSNSLTNLVFY